MTVPSAPKKRPAIPDTMRHNNFDIVRLTLAVIVVFVHCYDLSADPRLRILSQLVSSRMAVEGFFAISGFLIFASYERTPSLLDYCKNRAWRILPGYWLSTVICLLIAFSLGHFHVAKFLFANLTFANFLQPGIPGVFVSSPDNSAMNGSLWTIKIEVMFYVAVPFIVWLCRRLHRDAVLWTLFAMSVLFRVAFASHEKWTLQLPGQLSFFLIGTLIYYHLPLFKKHGNWFMLGGVLCYALHAWTGWFLPRPIAIATLTMVAALVLPHIKGPTRWGDFSYGTYILHYPIIQVLIAAGLFRWNPWAGLWVAVALVAIAAPLSWFFVEKPSLAHARSSRLRQEALRDIPNYPPAVP